MVPIPSTNYFKIHIMKMLFRVLLLLVILQMIACFDLLAQSGYHLEKSVFSSGGGSMSNTNFKLSGTLNQTAVGITQSAAVQQRVGFWYRLFDDVSTSLIETESRLKSVAKVFPNPATDYFDVKFVMPQGDHLEYKLYNAQGGTMSVGELGFLDAGEHILRFEVGGLHDGIYTYKITSRKLQFGGRIVVISTE